MFEKYISINTVVSDGAPTAYNIKNPIMYDKTANKRGKVLFVLSVMSMSVFIFFLRIRDVIMGIKAANIKQIKVISMDLFIPKM